MGTRQSPLHIRVFLSSPGDVTDERSVALQVLERIQYDPLLRGQITVEVIAWDKPGADTPLLATMTPQEAINQGLPTPAECDLVVVLFWARMGTPLPDEYVKPDGSRYLSGTEWEYQDALQASLATSRPLVVVYRRTEKILLDPSEVAFQPKLEQWQRVEAFFAGFVNPDGSIRQGYNQYQTPDDFREKFETHLKGLVKRLLDEPPPSPAAPAPEQELAPLWEGSPFPGLRAFTPADAPIFFGRGAETDALVRRLSDPVCRMVAVVGASGSGKSSLVGAGLIPRLAANAIEGSRDWVAVRFTPGELASGDPVEALVVALVRDLPALRAGGVVPRELTGRLHARREALGEVVQHALVDCPGWAEVVLFIDQFEELFSLVKPPHVAPFIDLLSQAARMPRVRTVLTLRADFYATCVEYPTLADLLETTTYPLAAPEMGALYEMVARPADLAGLTFETGLVDRILDDTGSEPGALALMAYALDELYRGCELADCLTHTAYQALGGVQGAIGERAEAVFQGMDADAQARLPEVFRELAEVDERGVAIRRRAGVERVARSEGARRLVDALTGARLLVLSQGDDEQPIVEVAHEALLRSWTRLARWIEDTQDDLRLLRQVRLGAAEWERAGRNSADLLTGTRLERARVRLQTDGLTPLERDFLDASAEADVRRQQVEQARQARELALQRRAANRLRYLAGAMAVFLVAAFILSLVAFGQRNNAQNAARSAETQAAIADTNLRESWNNQALYMAGWSGQELQQGDPRQAVLLALEGLAHYSDGIYNPENHQALLDSLAAPGLERLYLHHAGAVNGAAWNGDETRLLTWSDDGTARVWDAADGELLLTVRHEWPVTGAAWNGDESRLLTSSVDGTAQVWDAADGTELFTLRHESTVTGAAWNGDSTRILTWSVDGTARVWDAADGTELFTLRHASLVNGAAWNGDSTRILTWSDDGTARVWNAANRQAILTLLDGGRVLGAAWNGDETRLLTWSDDGTVRVWDAANGTVQFTLHYPGIGYYLLGAAWDGSGTRILTWSDDGTVRVWDAANGTVLLILHHEGDVAGLLGAAWDGSGTHILTWSADGTVRVWDDSDAPERLTLRHEGPVSGAAWSEDGTRILTWSADGSVRVSDAADPETPLTLRHERSDLGVRGAAWSGDETRILTWSDQNTLQVWSAVDGIVRLTLPNKDSDVRVWGAAWNNDGTRILTWLSDNSVQVYDAGTGEVLLTLRHEEQVYGAAWNQDGTHLLTWSDDGTARIWDVADGKPLLTLRHEGPVYGAAWDGEERRILTWSPDGTAQVWDAADGHLLLTVVHESLLGAAWSGDARRILTWSDDDTARLWDAATGELLLTVSHPGDEWGLGGAAVNRDATRVLTWADDGETRVWDAADGKLLFTLDSIAVVAGAVWNSDETRILTWSSDGAARVWDAAHGTLLLTLRHQSEVNGAAWNTDGTRILTWSRDGTARVWLVELDQLIILAKSYKLHPLNNDELASFFLPTLEPTATSTPLATIIPLPTITPEPAIPTATSVAAGSASVGDNRGEIAVGGGQIWTYQGQAGETVTFTVLADHPGSGNDPNEWVAKGLFDTLLGIYSPDGTPLVSNDDLDGTTLANGSVTDTNSQISDLTLPNDGAYLIEIRSAYGGKTGGEYTLVIESSRSAGPASTPTPTPTSAPTATPAP